MKRTSWPTWTRHSLPHAEDGSRSGPEREPRVVLAHLVQRAMISDIDSPRAFASPTLCSRGIRLLGYPGAPQ